MIRCVLNECGCECVCKYVWLHDWVRLPKSTVVVAAARGKWTCVCVCACRAIQLDNFHWKCDLMESQARLFWIRFKGNITFVVFSSKWPELIYFCFHFYTTRKNQTSTFFPFHFLQSLGIANAGCERCEMCCRCRCRALSRHKWPTVYTDFLICISIWTHSTLNDHYNFRLIFIALSRNMLYAMWWIETERNTAKANKKEKQMSRFIIFVKSSKQMEKRKKIKSYNTYGEWKML